MNDSFGLAAFRSRTQVLRMEDALHRAGLAAGVIATPREVAIGCGLSVRFDLAQTPQVMQVYRRLNPGALIGFAGRRVIEGTIGQTLPDDFQSSEFLLSHGFCDKIVPRNQLRETLEKLLKLHCGSKSKKWQVWRRD